MSPGVMMRRKGTEDVVTAARRRFLNLAASGLRLYVGFSGGKDSLVLGHILLELVETGQIPAKQIVMLFIDEEAMFEDVIRICHDWRTRCLLLGIEFRWYCLEVRHFNCFNQLENDESFVCWDRNMAGKWVRDPPDCAIRSHPLLKPAIDTYQSFLGRVCRDGIQVAGVRIAESVQRLMYFAAGTRRTKGVLDAGYYRCMHPIYDFKDNDVWLYLQEHNVEIPIEYLYLYQIGTNVHQLRIAAFFSIDCAKVLVQMAEYYPDLMERVVRREPNAYLAALYWNSEMFRRAPSQRKRTQAADAADAAGAAGTYRARVLAMLRDIPAHFDTPAKQQDARKTLNQISRHFHEMITESVWKRAYEILMAGDPKSRTLRAMIALAQSQYANATGANDGRTKDTL